MAVKTTVYDRRGRDDETDCHHGCKCSACLTALRDTTFEDARHAEDCELAGYDAAIREYARLYGAISQDRIDVQGAAMTYLDVAEIGDAVTSTASRLRMDKAQN